MYLLAIDASTKATGMAVFQGNKLIKYQCIQCSFFDPLDRIDYMREQIEKIFLQYNPSKVVMQDVLPEQVGHNQNVFKALIYLQATIVMMFHRHFKDVKLVTASHWRKICGIKTGPKAHREQLKRSSINLVKGIYAIDVNDDISDAICLGLAELIQGGSK